MQTPRRAPVNGRTAATARASESTLRVAVIGPRTEHSPGRRPWSCIAWLAVSLTWIVLLIGCSTVRRSPGELILLTGMMRKQLKLSNDDLRNLRYYLSAQLVLELRESSSAGSVVGGRLRVDSDRSEKRIIVTPQTPGKIETDSFADDSEHEHCLEVSFERNKPLTFCTHRNGPYRLIETRPRNPLKRFWDFLKNRPRPNPQTLFLGKSWDVLDGVEVRLLVERNSFGKFIRESQVLKGIR